MLGGILFFLCYDGGFSFLLTIDVSSWSDDNLFFLEALLIFTEATRFFMVRHALFLEKIKKRYNIKKKKVKQPKNLCPARNLGQTQNGQNFGRNLRRIIQTLRAEEYEGVF